MLNPTINLNCPVNHKNQQRLHKLVDTLFTDYSKLLVVRLDFYLQKKHKDFNNYHFMNGCFDTLRNNVRWNKSPFANYITYVARIEHGTDRLWHFHVVFFYDGQKVKNDYLLAKNMGEYWVNVVTDGFGQYYSANMNRSNYQDFALGMINYSDYQAISNLKAVLNYLVKENPAEPAMLDASGKAYRSYRPGQYKPLKSSLGRPRLYSSS